MNTLISGTFQRHHKGGSRASELYETEKFNTLCVELLSITTPVDQV